MKSVQRFQNLKPTKGKIILALIIFSLINVWTALSYSACPDNNTGECFGPPPALTLGIIIRDKIDQDFLPIDFNMDFGQIIIINLFLLIFSVILSYIAILMVSFIYNKPTKTMNNNQTQPTTQPNPNRFHLKTWQWLPVLILAAVIVAGVFVYINQYPQIVKDEQLAISPESQICIETSITEIVENPQKFDEANIRVSGEIHISQLMYSGTEGQAGGAIMEVFLRDNKFSVSLSVNGVTTGKLSETSNEFKTKYNSKKVVVEGRLQWSEGYSPSIAVKNIRLTEEVIITITTDETEYEQGEIIEITLTNNLNQNVQYWEGAENRGIPFIIEKFEDEEWKKISIPSACGCDPHCYQEAPGIMEIGQGGEINYEWDQKNGCQGKFVDEGKYRAWFTYYNPFDPTDFSKNTFTIYSNEFMIKEEQALIPQTKESCEAKGGQWGKWGLKPPEAPATCNLPTTDAGKECSGSNECEGACIAELTEEQKDMLNKTDEPVYTKGQCSSVNIVVGCHAYVINGKVEGILCAD